MPMAGCFLRHVDALSAFEVNVRRMGYYVDYLVKPVDPQQLIAAVGKAVSGNVLFKDQFMHDQWGFAPGA